MYHHLDESDGSDYVITPERFGEHMAALSGAGYNFVSMGELIGYVERGTALPDKALLITFDDGYLSNYDKAAPILEKYNIKAAFFLVGAFIGTDEYRGAGIPTMPYLGWETAREMARSDLFEIGSHTYDLHLVPEFEKGPGYIRQGVLPLPGEPEDDYIAVFRHDTEAFIIEYEKNLGDRPQAFSFPYGKYTKLAEALLAEYGFKITFTTQPGPNEIVKGLPQSLYGLNRYTVSGAMSGDDLLKLLEP